MKYVLMIYAPGNRGEDVIHTIESDAPFMPLSRGDILNPRTWPTHTGEALKSAAAMRYGAVLRVTGLEHFIAEVDGSVTRHAIGVFTTAIEDVAESRP